MSLASIINPPHDTDDACSRLFGPYLTKDEVDAVLAMGEEMARNTGTDRTPQFSNEPTLLSSDDHPPVRDTHVMVVDVGGRGVRAALRSVSSRGAVRWQPILDQTAQQLGDAVGGQTGLAALADLIAASVAKTSPERLDGLAVVWSSSIRMHWLPKSHDVCGFTASVQLGRHIHFGRNEWWAKELKDGDDVGVPFLDAFCHRGRVPRAFIIGNDTVFVAQAVEWFTNAGVVVSSGANTTVIPRGEFELRNARSGGIEVPRPQTSPDRLGGGKTTLQGLTSKSGVLPRFVSYVESAACAGQSDLAPLAEQLRSGQVEITRDLLNELATSGTHESRGGMGHDGLSPELWLPARSLAQGLIRRAAILSGCLAYFSIFNQLTEGAEFEIAMDSSQARFLPGFLPLMQDVVSQLVGDQRTARLHLLEPLAAVGGEISVPMRGAANAMSAFLAAHPNETNRGLGDEVDWRATRTPLVS